MANWNPWHGCHRISPGCKNCYVYRSDARYERDASLVVKTKDFDLPVRRNRRGEYKIPPASKVDTCFTSDFFLDDADEWRADAWRMIRERGDCHFLFITKRIDRFYVNLPRDWGGGYENVTICCTVENQDRIDFRLPVFLDAPIKHKVIVLEPLLEEVDLRAYLDKSRIGQVVAGGESGEGSRVCDYDWILKIRSQCIGAGVSFWFHQTGARFKKDGRIYNIPRRLHHSQARKAGIDTP